MLTVARFLKILSSTEVVVNVW